MFRNPVHHHFTSTSDAENFRILLRTLIFGLMWRCNKQKNRQPMLCFSAHFSAMAKIFVAASERFLRKKISLKFIFCVLFASELVACQIALEFLSRSSAYVPKQAGKLSACLRNENECNNKRNAFQFCRRSCKSAVEIPSWHPHTTPESETQLFVINLDESAFKAFRVSVHLALDIRTHIFCCRSFALFPLRPFYRSK